MKDRYIPIILVDIRWFQIDELPKLGFHHEQIINDFLKED